MPGDPFDAVGDDAARQRRIELRLERTRFGRPGRIGRPAVDGVMGDGEQNGARRRASPPRAASRPSAPGSPRTCRRSRTRCSWRPSAHRDGPRRGRAPRCRDRCRWRRRPPVRSVRDGLGHDLAPRLGPVVGEQLVVRLVDGGDAVRRELARRAGRRRRRSSAPPQCRRSVRRGASRRSRLRTRPARSRRGRARRRPGPDHRNTPSSRAGRRRRGPRRRPLPSTTVFDACSAGVRSRTICWPPGSAAAVDVRDLDLLRRQPALQRRVAGQVDASLTPTTPAAAVGRPRVRRRPRARSSTRAVGDARCPWCR